MRFLRGERRATPSVLFRKKPCIQTIHLSPRGRGRPHLHAPHATQSIADVSAARGGRERGTRRRRLLRRRHPLPNPVAKLSCRFAKQPPALAHSARALNDGRISDSQTHHFAPSRGRGLSMVAGCSVAKSGSHSHAAHRRLCRPIGGRIPGRTYRRNVDQRQSATRSARPCVSGLMCT